MERECPCCGKKTEFERIGSNIIRCQECKCELQEGKEEEACVCSACEPYPL